MCKIAHARASHAQSNTHTHSVQRQEWKNTDCVVVTMALVSDFSHSVSHVAHCCQKSSLPLLPFRSASRSGRFASMSTRSLVIHPSTPAVPPAPPHCSLVGGATRTRSDAATCVLPSDATRTRHDDAIFSKRLTVPCDSDFLCVSVISDGLASQHACSPTVLNTISLVSSSAVRGVFLHARRVFESAWRLYSQGLFCIDDFTAEGRCSRECARRPSPNGTRSY